MIHNNTKNLVVAQHGVAVLLICAQAKSWPISSNTTISSATSTIVEI